MKLYYVQDCRQCVGNCALWWAKDAAGYTCELDKAHVYTEEEIGTRKFRETDVPRLKEEMDRLAIRHVRVDGGDAFTPKMMDRR